MINVQKQAQIMPGCSAKQMRLMRIFNCCYFKFASFSNKGISGNFIALLGAFLLGGKRSQRS